MSRIQTPPEPREGLAHDYQQWAVVAMDGSGRYATSDDWTLANIRLHECSRQRPGTTFILMRWNGAHWRERGHWSEYAERTFGRARCDA